MKNWILAFSWVVVGLIVLFFAFALMAWIVIHQPPILFGALGLLLIVGMTKTIKKTLDEHDSTYDDRY